IYIEHYATNDPSFRPILMDRQFTRGMVHFETTLDDGTHPPVDIADDGTFSFPLAHDYQAYRLIASSEFGQAEYQLWEPSLRLGVLAAGRPDRYPPVFSNVQFAYPAGATSTAYIATTGLWSHTNAFANVATIVFDWQFATPTAASVVGLLDA